MAGSIRLARLQRFYGNFKHDEARSLEIDGVKKTLVVSKVFDNEDFGYNKITVEGGHCLTKRGSR